MFLITKTYVGGTCYYPTDKYCPTTLESCKSEKNFGNKWTLKGEIYTIKIILLYG